MPGYLSANIYMKSNISFLSFANPAFGYFERSVYATETWKCIVNNVSDLCHISVKTTKSLFVTKIGVWSCRLITT